ncbi:MAG: hypothetical protein R3E95_02840 [Thiolinea sp.]
MLTVLLVGLFLPLFPLSMVFNQLLARSRHPLPRLLLLMLWPQAGVLLLMLLDTRPPGWVLLWAVLSALLYAFRLLTQREVNSWLGFLATSAWSLLWLPAATGYYDSGLLAAAALGFSIPLALLVLLAAVLEQRFGVAYTHLYAGLATPMPRFAGLLIFSILAAIATPVFPAFFTLLDILTLSDPLLAVLILLVWLLWSWAGIRLLQGLLVGSAPQTAELQDIQRSFAGLSVLILAVLAIAGLYATGGMA